MEDGELRIRRAAGEADVLLVVLGRNFERKL